VNREIRAALGRPLGERGAPESPVGDLGIGRGGACAQQPVRTQSTEISDQIRAAIGHVRGTVTPDDLWGR
jgi:hypothetical protein